MAALTLAFASAAHAATTVGQLITPTFDCTAESVTAFQTGVDSGTSYVVPTAGVITSWSVQDGATTIDDLRFKVARLVSGTEYTIVGDSAAGPQTPNTVSTYPTRIPVRAGDVIGFFADGGHCATTTTGPGDSVVSTMGDQVLNSTATYMAVTGLLPIAAKVEPDADGDGFGDETQDACPTNASTQGACPVAAPPPPLPPVAVKDRTPPSVKFSIARHLKLSKRGSIVFRLRTSENGAGRASGTIRLPQGSFVRFRSAKLKLQAGRRAKVTLKLTKKALRLVRRALRHHRLKAKVTVKLKDTAGNPTTKTLSRTLRR